MNEKTKKILNIAKTVFTWAVVAFAVFMMILTLFNAFALDKNERSFLGTRFYIVQTDSMSKSENNKDMDVHFNAGDIIFAKKPKSQDDINDLVPGDIISFISSNPDSWGETITHMIHDVIKDENGNVVEIVTFGTNTGAIDEEPVDPNFVLGKYKGKIPKVGHFFAFMRSTPGYICCILVPFLFIIIYNLINVISLFKKYKSEQNAALQEERAKLDKDREENQRMMAELMALKAKLEGTAPPEAAPDAPPAQTPAAAPEAVPAPEVAPDPAPAAAPEAAPAPETVSTPVPEADVAPAADENKA